MRWSGRHSFGAGDYTFTAVADDGVRVLVDGTEVLNGWYPHGPLTFTGTRQLTAGEHEVIVEFFEAGGGAMVQVMWR